MLGGQVKAICRYPVIHLSDAVTDNAKRFFALIDTGCTKKNDGIVKDKVFFWNRIRLDTVFGGNCLDAADKVFAFSLQRIIDMCRR